MIVEAFERALLRAAVRGCDRAIVLAASDRVSEGASERESY